MMHGLRMAPLTGVRVLDLTRVLAGPWCTQNLADLGAEVIKVERPVQGDDTRHWGPPYMRDSTGEPTAEAAYYAAANRNKKSITIDMSTPEGADAIRQLAQKSDILVENFKVGGLKKYGLDYPTLHALCPHLIYCSITGFGQTGPYADRPGYDFMIQAMGGLMSITGEQDNLPGGGPQKAGVAVADLMTGMYATVGILAALHERSRSGLGQHIDMALLDCQVAMLANQNMNYLATEQAPQRVGNAHPNLVPYQVFEVADGHLIIAVGNDMQFQAFVHALGCPELAQNPLFATNPARVQHRAELIPLLQSHLKKQNQHYWQSRLEAAKVPVGPINTLDQVYSDPQVQARALQIQLPHSTAGQMSSVANPIRLSASPLRYDSAPPVLGEHTEQVLKQLLGLDSNQINALQGKHSGF